MAAQVTNYQCPACTGPLQFDAGTDKLVCEYCSSSYSIAEIEAMFAENALMLSGLGQEVAGYGANAEVKVPESSVRKLRRRRRTFRPRNAVLFSPDLDQRQHRRCGPCLHPVRHLPVLSHLYHGRPCQSRPQPPGWQNHQPENKRRCGRLRYVRL